MSFNINVDNYKKIFPKYPPVINKDNWIYGMWMIGNYYKRKHGYYGEYPPSYLKRVYSLFEGGGNILHLFSGMVDKITDNIEITFDADIFTNPDILGSANNLSSYNFKDKFDLILADPPYSREDALQYGTSDVYPNKKKVLNECYKISNDNCYLIWLDLMIPIYKKVEWKLIGTIGLITGTNRRTRIISIFERSK